MALTLNRVHFAVALQVCLLGQAYAQDTWVNVEIGCCSVQTSRKVTTQGLRGMFTGELGAVSVSCDQFFAQDTATYPGGLPQRDGTRTINLRSLNTAEVRRDLCSRLRQAEQTCCAAFNLCEQSCGQSSRQNFQKLHVGLAQDSNNPSAEAVINRFLSTCEANTLLEELVNMPCPGHWNAAASCRMGDYLKFRIQFRERQASDLEAGSVDLENPFPDPSTADPDALKRYIYNVSITNERVRLSEGGGVLLTNSFPDPRDSCFSYRFSDPTSAMAATLYHELLHIWWMNKNQTNRLLSGHGPDLRSCANYEPGFVQRLRGFYRAMDALDSCLAKPAPKPTTTGKPQPTARPSP